MGPGHEINFKSRERWESAKIVKSQISGKGDIFFFRGDRKLEKGIKNILV